jgi:DNA-binding response OmpR family regulator
VGDGGKKPTSPQELEARLQAMIPEEDRNFIHIRVLDVSWPTK